MNHSKHRLSRCGLLASVAIFAMPAHAHAQPQEQGAETDETIELITVTAQRRSQSIQDIPFSITALGEQELERRNISSLGDYAASVPGVSYIDEGPTGTRGNRTLAIRGISSQNTSGSVGVGTVGYYLDETPVPVLDPQIFDVERIEILKGPQSTLYGAGSVGGTFRVITNQPRLNVTEGRAELQASTTRDGEPSFALRGALNVPLANDVAALRVVGWYRNDGGWTDNYPQGADTPPSRIQENWNDVERYGGRVSAVFQLTDRFSLTPAAMYQRTREYGSTNVDLRLGGYRTRAQLDNPSAQETFSLLSLVARYDLGFAELTSSTSRFRQRIETLEDASGSQGIPIPPDDFADTPDQSLLLRPRSFTQELRLVSRGGGRFNWLGGLFYTKTETRTFFEHEQAGVFPIPLIYQLDGYQEFREKAAYGEISFDLTDRLTVSGGLRYFETSTGFNNRTAGFLGGTVSSAEARESGVRPKFYVSYDVTDDVMLYGTASQGFRAGGGLFPLPSQCEVGLRALGLFPAPTSFESDSVWNYEGGIKTSWLNRRIVANAAVFYLDWSNIQQSFPVGNGCPFQVTANTGSAVARGFEIDLTVRPVTNLSLEFALGYTDAEITEPPLAGAGAKGDPLLNVPNLNIHAAAQLDFNLGSVPALARIDYTYVDDKTITFNRAAPIQELGSFQIVNARVGATFGRLETSLYIENLFNSRGQTDYSEGAAVAGRVQARGWDLIRPRTIGMSVGTRF